MNNKTLALMRREFKLESYVLPIKEIYSVYLKKDNEETKLNIEDIQEVLKENDVNTEFLKGAFEEVCGGDYKFRAKNIIPDFWSRSMKIQNENIEINIVPDHLRSIKQVRDKEGRKCLNVVLSDDVLIDGIGIETQA